MICILTRSRTTLNTRIPAPCPFFGAAALLHNSPMSCVKEPEKKVPKGMVCPNGCDGTLQVRRTRIVSNGVVVRRRVCKSCNYRVTTEEKKRSA